MLYSFEIQYNDGVCKNIPVTIIMNLPQARLDEVKKNPFVIDIVNYPFFKAGIAAVQNHSQELVDNSQVYNSTIPHSANEIICKFREQSSLGNYKTFGFKIYADVPFGCFWPFGEIEFVCKSDYDSMERLFQSNRFVLAPHVPNSMAGIAEGYYYQIGLTATVDLVRIKKMDDPQNAEAEIIDAKGSITPVPLSSVIVSSLVSIRLTDELLTMIGFNHQRGNIYDLTDVDYFEGVLTGGNPKAHVYLLRDSVGYSLMVQDVNNPNSCQFRKCIFLQELQHFLLKEYNAKINLSNQSLAKVCLYLNDVLIGARVIEQLPTVIENFMKQNAGQQTTVQDKVNFVANAFSISDVMAEHFLLTRYLYY